METKYKGYEELLDVDEDDSDILIPRDVQGSVRALTYALAHPLIFSESHGTYKERRVKKEKVIYMLILWYKHLGKANSEAPVFRLVRALNYLVSQKFVTVRYKSVFQFDWTWSANHLNKRFAFQTNSLFSSLLCYLLTRIFRFVYFRAKGARARVYFPAT